MVKVAARKPGPPKVKKSGPFKIKQTVALKAKKPGSPGTKKTGSPKGKTGLPSAKKTGFRKVKKDSPAAKETVTTVAKKKASTKFLALKKANDRRFRWKSVQRRQAFKKGEDVEDKRGVVVLSNIPHGFFEGQMERYFRQFGVLENLRLVRSQRTGQSCGYAYIEFQHYEVAKIVAKSMDGYLTFGKIMKCKVLPPEYVSNKLFKGKNIRPDDCPKLNMRKGAIKKLNKRRTEKQIERRVARLTSAYMKKARKLQELGVDIPLETLIGKPLPQEKKEAGDEDATKLTNGHTASEDTPSEEEGGQTHFALPEDASDVEPSEDIDPELTEEQKGELNSQRDELAAMIKSHLGSAKKTKPKKKGGSKTQAEMMVLEVDESDDEVVLKTPPNAIKKYVKMGSASTPTTTLNSKILALKGKSVTPKAGKTKMTPKGKSMTPKAKKIKLSPQGGNKTPKLTDSTTPKAKKMKLSQQGGNIAAESNENITPKAKKTKTTPKGEKRSTQKQKNETEEPPPGTPTNATPRLKTVMPQAGKVTPKSEKKTGTPKVKKATPKTIKVTPKLEELPDTSRVEELESMELLPTPKTKKQKLKVKNLSAEGIQTTPSNEAEEVSAIETLPTPKSGQKTPKNKTKTPKLKQTPAGDLQSTPTTRTFEAEEIIGLEMLTTPTSGQKTPKKKMKTPKVKKAPAGDIQTTPTAGTPGAKEVQGLETFTVSRIGGKMPKAKKQTPKFKASSIEDTQPTPSLDTLGAEEETVTDALFTSKMKVKTPKAKKQTPNIKNLSEEAPGGKKTPKAKKTDNMGENKENKGNFTPKNKSVGKTLTPNLKKMPPTPTLTTESDVTISMLENAVTLSEATPGKKKKEKQTPTHTPKVTPGKGKKGSVTPLAGGTPGKKEKGNSSMTPGKRKQGDMTPLTEATPGKKEKMKNKTTPGKSMALTPKMAVTSILKTPKKAVTTTPKTPTNSVPTPGKKTPKGTPGKRKSMLEILPDGKSHSKKQKVLTAT